MSRVAALFLIGAVVVAYAQSDAEKAVQLALDGRWPEAMTLLKEAMATVQDSSMSFRAIRIFFFWPCTFIRIWPS
jgi:hypothetical protein